MKFDLQVVPFSRYGSYIAFSHLAKSDGWQDGLYMRSVHGSGFHAGVLHPIFRVELLQEGKPVPFQEIATPTVLRLETEGRYAEICIAEPKLVRIRSVGAGIRLTMETGMFDNAIPIGDRHWQVVNFASGIKYMLTPLQGELAMDAPWRVDKSEHIVADFLPDPDTEVFEGAVEEFISVWHRPGYEKSFDACLSAVKEEYQVWLERMPEVAKAYAEGGELAAYINWSCVVDPEGHLTRPAMLMSKNWMNSLWSWDNCFNAMALIGKQPELAWDQFMLLVDKQDSSGAFPDSINDSLVHWSFCKPPIHGWALRWMMERTDFIDARRLQEVYGPLCRWTQWWFDYRDDDDDAIPQYNHGNDSGWDNATVFEAGPPVESPDLLAYIIIQMEVLAEVARVLDKAREADVWKSRANILLQLMLKHSWQGNHFIAPRSGDHQTFESDSLILFMPIILGKRLPSRVMSTLIEGLKEEGRFLTEHGLATESPRSLLYQSDGYWRGPIWAPSTMMIVDGLAAAGEMEFARELARRFCDMAARSGMAENYDAITGVGLRDRAYTWTSSVFLILAHEYLRSRDGEEHR
jgi:putative isomerase